MKKNIFLLFTLLGLVLLNQNLSAQEKNVKEPGYVIIAGNKIITKKQLFEYGRQGLVKSMQKGVTQSVRDKLAKKFGDKIGYRKFIILIELRDKPIKSDQRSTQNGESSSIKTRKNEDEFKLNIGDITKDFTVQMMNGREITLSKLKGNVVLLDFWAPWCAPCLMEFTKIPEKILEPFKNKKFIFIPISIGKSKKNVKKTMAKMKEYGVKFDVGIDLSKEIWNKYATGSIPKSFLIDKNGVIKYVSVGYNDGDLEKVAKEIKKLFKN